MTVGLRARVDGTMLKMVPQSARPVAAWGPDIRRTHAAGRCPRCPASGGCTSPGSATRSDTARGCAASRVAMQMHGDDQEADAAIAGRHADVPVLAASLAVMRI
jgi:hypothetical protein